MRVIAFSAAVVFCALAFGADEPNEQHHLAAELLDAMNMEAQVSQSFEVAKAAIPAQMKQMEAVMPAGPKGEKRGLQAEQTKKMMDKMMDMFAEEMKWEKIKADYIELYAETFSTAELEDLVVFYRSPAGKALVAKQPELARKSMEMSQKSMVRLMPKIIAMTAEATKETVEAAKKGSSGISVAG